MADIGEVRLLWTYVAMQWYCADCRQHWVVHYGGIRCEVNCASKLYRTSSNELPAEGVTLVSPRGEVVAVNGSSI